MSSRQVIGRCLRQYVFPVVTACWAAGHRLMGWIAPPRVRTWASQGNERVVIVAPHPDDETLGAGGVALLHRQAGDIVSAVIITDGRASRAGGLGPDEMAQRRASEVQEAGRVLGLFHLTCLHMPEGQWQEHEARPLVASLLQRATIVYAPSCVDFHPEHVKVARLVASLVRPDQTVRIYEIGVPLTPRLVNLVADIGPVATTKEQALRVYATQTDALTSTARLATYRARRYRLGAAEVFWELPASVYAQRMVDGDWRGGSCPYRGIRSRPLTDPLSFWVGHKARIALRTRADDLKATVVDPSS